MINKFFDNGRFHSRPSRNGRVRFLVALFRTGFLMREMKVWARSEEEAKRVAESRHKGFRAAVVIRAPRRKVM